MRKGTLIAIGSTLTTNWVRALLVVRVLPIAIKVTLRMSSTFYGGERKDQLRPGEIVPVNGIPFEGYPEGSRRVWNPQ